MTQKKNVQSHQVAADLSQYTGQWVLVHPRFGVVIHDADAVLFTEKRALLKSSVQKKCSLVDLTGTLVDVPKDVAATSITERSGHGRNIYFD